MLGSSDSIDFIIGN